MTSRRMSDDMRRISHDYVGGKGGLDHSALAAQRSKVSQICMPGHVHLNRCLYWSPHDKVHVQMAVGWCTKNAKSSECSMLLSQQRLHVCSVGIGRGKAEIVVSAAPEAAFAVQVLPASATFNALVYLSTIHAVRMSIPGCCQDIITGCQIKLLGSAWAAPCIKLSLLCIDL